MKVLTEVVEVRAFSRACRAEGKRVGFVPTMGSLHAGHLSLVALAKEHSDVVVVSNYVNPTQFAAHEDFDVYPRDLESDREKLQSAGCDVVFEPVSLYAADSAARFPSLPGSRDPPTDPADSGLVVGRSSGRSPHQTFVTVEKLEKPLCGISRPHFFRGVATAVTKLFNIVEPDVAVFGLKDYQQYQVIKTLARELDFGVEIVGGPIHREPDGLAMSSRNALLHEDVRPDCTVLYESLQWAKGALQAIGVSPDSVVAEVRRRIEERGGKVDYVRIIHPETLEEVADTGEHASAVVALAAFFMNRAREPSVRLIDNCLVELHHAQC